MASRVSFVFLGLAVIALLGVGLAFVLNTNDKPEAQGSETASANLGAGKLTSVCDNFLQAMPARGPERVAAGKDCRQELPNLAVPDQLAILNAYASDLPGYIPNDEMEALIDELDREASLPLRAHRLRLLVNGPDPELSQEIEETITESREANNKPALANALLAQAVMVTNPTDIDEGILEEALTISTQENFAGVAPYIYNLWALKFNLQGDYQESIGNYIQAREGFEASADYTGTALVLINLSYVYAEFEDTRKAIEFAQEAIEVLDKNLVDEPLRKAAAYLALAEHLSLAEKHIEAVGAFREVSSITSDNGIFVPPDITVSEIRAVYKSGEKDNAINRAEELLSSSAIEGSSHTKRELNAWLGARYADAENYAKAQERFEAFMASVASENSSLEQVLENVGSETVANLMVKDLLLASVAAEATDEAIILANLANERRALQIENAKVKAVAGHELQTDIKEKDKSISTLASEAERSELQLRTTRLQVALALAVACIFGVLAFQFFRTSKAQRQLGQVKETFLQEIHHRTKNNLQVLTSVLSLDIRRADREERGEGPRIEAVNRVEMMGLIHDHVYNVSAEEGTEIEVEEFIDDLLALLDSSMGRDNVELTWTVRGGTIDVSRITPFGLLICELVTNSYKHAFDNEGGLIEVNVSAEDDNLHLRISDNGKGFDPNTAPHKKGSIGLTLALSLAEQAEGKLTVESSENGTVWSFK